MNLVREVSEGNPTPVIIGDEQLLVTTCPPYLLDIAKFMLYHMLQTN